MHWRVIFGLLFPRVILLQLETNQSWTAVLLNLQLRHQRSQNHFHLIKLLAKEITSFFLAKATLVLLQVLKIPTKCPYHVKNLLKYAPVPLFYSLLQQETEWFHHLQVVEVIKERQILMAKIWRIAYKQVDPFMHELFRWVVSHLVYVCISSISFDSDNLFPWIYFAESYERETNYQWFEGQGSRETVRFHDMNTSLYVCISLPLSCLTCYLDNFSTCPGVSTKPSELSSQQMRPKVCQSENQRPNSM